MLFTLWFLLYKACAVFREKQPLCLVYGRLKVTPDLVLHFHVCRPSHGPTRCAPALIKQTGKQRHSRFAQDSLGTVFPTIPTGNLCLCHDVADVPTSHLTPTLASYLLIYGCPTTQLDRFLSVLPVGLAEEWSGQEFKGN